MRTTVSLLVAIGLLPLAEGAREPAIPKADRAAHAASRLTWGPRPGDIEAIRRTGVERWIAAQLNPESIAEDPELERRVAAMPTLQQSTGELMKQFRERKQDRSALRPVLRELHEAKILRAVHTHRQLEDVLADFWFNHFNVFLNKGADRVLTGAYEREAIRPHVLGKFRHLLGATAEHPAMLWYLDNWQSVSPDSPVARRARRARGLNENYARELLELHTLGVDGGYTQKDVGEVARCFTGWTIRDGGFGFVRLIHDNGEKVVLGTKIPAGNGKADGERVLDLLARHPSTARFISRKLAQRFVNDNPPEALIDAMAKAWGKTDGDLRAVVKTMTEAPEFWSASLRQSEVKSPIEFVVSALRASGAEIRSAMGVVLELDRMGQPLYRKQEPTGYKDTSEEWANSAGLLARMNFAAALAGNRVPGVHATWPEDARSSLLALASPDLRRRIEASGQDKAVELVLGSPDFQRR